jgi:SAM-dependent methyltransferase
VKFLEFASEKVEPSDKVLDAGAGTCQFKKYFSHAHYESTDFENIFDKDSKHLHHFLCSLDNIPKPENYYHAIINIQVLEHIENPQKAVKEFYRILKPGGKLFLTAPQGWRVHGEPYHFFNFTNFGLESLFKNAGFKVIFIKPRGGMFWYLGYLIRSFPNYIMFQYSFQDSRYFSVPTAFLLFPFYIIAKPLCEIFIPLIFFYLDRLDKKQAFTLGYSCYCIKEKNC